MGLRLMIVVWVSAWNIRGRVSDGNRVKSVSAGGLRATDCVRTIRSLSTEHRHGLRAALLQPTQLAVRGSLENPAHAFVI